MLAFFLAFSALAPAEDLVVHEWGTFTSVVGADGKPVSWRPLAGRDDLPSFVHRTWRQDAFRSGCEGKGCHATVRMETPVIYFHTHREQDVAVSVGFRGGRVTEVFPFASGLDGGVDWGRVHLVPGASATLPREPGESHYYPAREVDAAAVRVCGRGRTEWEKFLFYRGIGDFPLPVEARLQADRVSFAVAPGGVGPRALMVRSDGKRLGFAWIRADAASSTSLPALSGTVDDGRAALRMLLADSGLFTDEREAMLATWKDDWLEPGVRVFYLLAPDAIEERLPLRLEPRPDALVRVLVGRVEFLTPEAIDRARTSARDLASFRDPATLDGRRAALLSHEGRFAEPLLSAACATLRAEEADRCRAALGVIFGEPPGFVPVE